MKGIKYRIYSPSKKIEIKRCNASLHSSKPHFHSEISVGLIENGQCETTLQGQHNFLQSRSLLLIPPDIIHQCHPIDSKKWGFTMAYIHRDWFESIFNISSKQLSFIYKNLDRTTYDMIKKAFTIFEQEDISLTQEVHLLDLLLSHLHPSNKSINPVVSQSNTSRIKDIYTYLHEFYLQPVTLNDLEKVSGLTKYYIVRQFKALYGMSPHQYLTTLRINHAKNMLKANHSISDTALSAGFYDQSHFTKYFKQYIGLTPIRYQKDILQ